MICPFCETECDWLCVLCESCDDCCVCEEDDDGEGLYNSGEAATHTHLSAGAHVAMLESVLRASQRFVS